MIYIWLIPLFMLGAVVGSFLNVCVHRLPFEKTVFWPGSRCGACYQPVRWYDNIPLLSYWILRGRCRSCGASFSMRYFFIELLTACCFPALFYVEIIRNIHDFPQFNPELQWGISYGVVPQEAWGVFAYHALLLSFLLVVSLCDLEHMEIPLSVTVTGTIVGLIGATLFPWPWPNIATGPFPQLIPANPAPRLGLLPWPVWQPLPAWLQPGNNWQTGLTTSVAGMLAGSMTLRAIRFLFGVGRGIEGMGAGDADLMMMAGSFLGWQPTVVAFFIAVAPALVIGIGQLVVHGDRPMPFGPSLALGVVITWLGWHWIGPPLAPLLFDSTLMLIGIIGGGIGFLVISFMLRIIRG